MVEEERGKNLRGQLSRSEQNGGDVQLVRGEQRLGK